MGWDTHADPIPFDELVTDQLRHCQAVASTRNRDPDAVAEFVRRCDEQPDRELPPLEIWYLAPQYDRPSALYPGVILFNLFTPDRQYRKFGRDATVRCWSYNIMSADMGPLYYDCPPEYIDKTVPANDCERQWRLDWAKANYERCLRPDSPAYTLMAAVANPVAIPADAAREVLLQGLERRTDGGCQPVSDTVLDRLDLAMQNPARAGALATVRYVAQLIDNAYNAERAVVAQETESGIAAARADFGYAVYAYLELLVSCPINRQEVQDTHDRYLELQSGHAPSPQLRTARTDILRAMRAGLELLESR